MTTYPFTRANVDETVNRVYDFIANYIEENGFSPSVRDICDGVGVKSTSTVHSHLKRLRDDGRIEYVRGKRRAITLADQDQSRVVQLPLVGKVTAGVPILAHENIERSIPVPADFFADTDNMFVLQVSGDSMIDAAILDGDYVFVRKQAAADFGDIIVALIGDEATVKTLARLDGRIVLRPENDAYEPIPFDQEECRILGKVCGVFRVTS